VRGSFDVDQERGLGAPSRPALHLYIYIGIFIDAAKGGFCGNVLNANRKNFRFGEENESPRSFPPEFLAREMSKLEKTEEPSARRWRWLDPQL
jgi:hypothetical protein